MGRDPVGVGPVDTVGRFDRVMRLVGLVVCLLTADVCRADDAVLSARVDEPLAYGWRIGDRVRRVVHITVPPGWQIDERSLPRPDQRGGEVELRAWSLVPEPGSGGDVGRRWTTGADGSAGQVDTAEPGEVGAAALVGAAAGEAAATSWDDVMRQGWSALQPTWKVLSRNWAAALPKDGRDGTLAVAARLRGVPAQQLVLDYQLFATAPAPRVLELPTLTLVYEPLPGQVSTSPRELRLPARPLWLVPLAAGAPGHQDGLGEMRPDVGVQGLATEAATSRLLLSLLCAAALLGLTAAARLALRLAGVTGQAQPFQRAWRELRRLLPRRRGRGLALSTEQRQAALRLLHQAFDHSAGRTLLPRQARAWAASDVRFAAQADAVERFFQGSADQFFGAAATGRVGDAAGAAVPGLEPSAASVDEARDLLDLARALARAEAGARGGRHA